MAGETLSIAEFDSRSPTQRWSGYQPGQGESEQAGYSEVGRRWWVPDPEARERLCRYLDDEALMDVDCHHRLYVRLGLPGPEDSDRWIPVDFPGTVARLVRHYLMGPDFEVTAKKGGAAAQERIDALGERSEIRLLLRQVGEAMPSLGDAVLRVDVEDVEDEDGALVPRAVFKFIHPGHYFPTLDPTDATRVTAVTLAWVLPREGMEETAWPLQVLKEVHTPGRVDYYLVAWNGKEEGEDLDLEEAGFGHLEGGETGIDEIPVVLLPFNVAGGEHFGRSVFGRVKRIFLAIENRLSQEDEILDGHARPKLIVGPGVLGPDGRANLQEFDVIEVEPGMIEKGVKPEYLTWDPQIEAIKHQLDKLLEFFFMTTETSPSSFGLERDGSQVESARALRFKAHRTINMVEDLRDVVKPRVEKLYRIAQKMESAAIVQDKGEPVPWVPVSAYFPDPVIEDQAQEVQDYVAMVGGKLCSRKRAVQDLFDLDDKQAEAEVREILQDMTDELAATPAASSAPIEGDVQDGETPPTDTTPAAQA